MKLKRRTLWVAGEGASGAEVIDADFVPEYGVLALVADSNGLSLRTSPGGMRLPCMQADVQIARWLSRGKILLAPSWGASVPPPDWSGPPPADESFAWILDEHGRPEKPLRLGVDLTNVAVSGSGRIWVGYGDEGVSGYGPLESEGLVQFDVEGTVRFRYQNGLPDRPFIDDCYALCPDESNGVWMCAYSSFRLVHLGSDGRVLEVVPTPERVKGPQAILVQDRDALFVRPWGRVSEVVRWRVGTDHLESIPLEPGRYRPVRDGSQAVLLQLTARTIDALTPELEPVR